MNTFGIVLTLLALAFLFQGDPDLWDRLHDKAMNSACMQPMNSQATPLSE